MNDIKKQIAFLKKQRETALRERFKPGTKVRVKITSFGNDHPAFFAEGIVKGTPEHKSKQTVEVHLDYDAVMAPYSKDVRDDFAWSLFYNVKLGVGVYYTYYKDLEKWNP